jgi:hypothetical protein
MVEEEEEEEKEKEKEGRPRPVVDELKGTEDADRE